jgi:hypothetical protein
MRGKEAPFQATRPTKGIPRQVTRVSHSSGTACCIALIPATVKDSAGPASDQTSMRRATSDSHNTAGEHQSQTEAVAHANQSAPWDLCFSTAYSLWFRGPMPLTAIA